MKPFRHVHAALAALALASAACTVSSGAPELTAVGPSRAEMTASVTPFRASAILSSTPTPTSPARPTESVTIPPPSTQRPAPLVGATSGDIPTSVPSAAPPTVTATPCGIAWFTTHAPPGSCPDSSPVQLEAAYQAFEHGAMLWRKTRGYIILPFNPATEVQSGPVSFYSDEVTIYRDTSAEMSPPSGLLAPVSGFGLMWRGDIFEQPGAGFKTTLGWATASETGYTVTEQTGCQLVFHGVPNASLMSYFTLPDGRLLTLSRLATPNQPTSLNFLTP